MERLKTEQPKGLTIAGIRKWGMLFLIIGLFGRIILMNRVLGLNTMSSDELLAAMNSGSNVMALVTIALVSQFVEVLAAPIFCLLLAEGMIHTASAPKYLARILGVAVISELPFNFAMYGKVLDLSTRNPVFGMVMAALLLYLYQLYGDRSLKNILLKAAFTIASVFWIGLLRIESGLAILLITVVFWVFRKKPNIRNLMAGIAAMVCSLLSIFFMMAPMSMMVLHFYNGEKGEENRLVSYLFYPAVLLILGLVGVVAF